VDEQYGLRKIVPFPEGVIIPNFVVLQMMQKYMKDMWNVDRTSGHPTGRDLPFLYITSKNKNKSVTVIFPNTDA